MRDRLWSKKIERAIVNYNLLDYDYYHFEWGLDLYRNFSFAKRIKKLNKPIIAHYHGQDLRARGIFKKMDEFEDFVEAPEGYSLRFTKSYFYLISN